MTDAIRIANCSGFYGDRLSAAKEMVEGGPIDALTGDWLAELTMLILARTQAKRPGSGYARTFVTQMEQVMGTCLDQGIKVVSNAGGLDPDHCAEPLRRWLTRWASTRPSPTSTATTCCRARRAAGGGIDILDLETGEPVAPVDYISANAYLGAWGIVEALNRGADIVVTGRTTDARSSPVRPPGITAGPRRLGRHGRRSGGRSCHRVRDAGDGGNYSFFTEIPGLERAGFPSPRSRRTVRRSSPSIPAPGERSRSARSRRSCSMRSARLAISAPTSRHDSTRCS